MKEYNVAKGIQEWKDPNAEPPTLYGVPICIKDIIALKGSLHTAGVACRTAEHLRCTQDCVAVQVLRSAGALPMVKSNVPQLLMLPETYNNVWGRTRNPWNLKRIPGKVLFYYPCFCIEVVFLFNFANLWNPL